MSWKLKGVHHSLSWDQQLMLLCRVPGKAQVCSRWVSKLAHASLLCSRRLRHQRRRHRHRRRWRRGRRPSMTTWTARGSSRTCSSSRPRTGGSSTSRWASRRRWEHFFGTIRFLPASGTLWELKGPLDSNKDLLVTMKTSLMLKGAFVKFICSNFWGTQGSFRQL